MSWSRKKSCAPCIASKARCNQGFPACSRCAERELPCRYEGRVPDRRTAPYPTQRPHVPSRYPDPTQVQGRPTIQPEFSSGTIDSQFDDSLADVSFQDLPLDVNFDWMLSEGLESASKNIELPFTNVCEQRQTPCPAETEISGDIGQILLGSERVEKRRRLTLSTAGVQQVSAQRTLMRRGAHSTCPLTSMVLGQILGYPRMLIEGDQPPPFIHPTCYINEELAHDCTEAGKHTCLPKDLAVCSGLVGMFYDRTTASASFVWETVNREVDRIREEFYDMSSSDQLSSLQSVVVLLLLQAEAPETAIRNGVSNLIETISACLSGMIRNSAWDRDLSPDSTDRREWVRRESVRRVVSVLGVIDLLLEGVLSASHSSHQDFGDVPLPSHRRLWGARTNKLWRTAYRQYCSDRVTNRTLRVNDLIESDDAGCFSNQRTNIHNNEVFPDVLKWCESSDMLSTLIWMAMPFEQHRRRTIE